MKSTLVDLNQRMAARFPAIAFESEREHEAEARGMEFEPAHYATEAVRLELEDLVAAQWEFELGL